VLRGGGERIKLEKGSLLREKKNRGADIDSGEEKSCLAGEQVTRSVGKRALKFKKGLSRPEKRRLTIRGERKKKKKTKSEAIKIRKNWGQLDNPEKRQF